MNETIHLQGLGEMPAMRAEELRPGDILSWNYSPNNSVIVSVTPVSACFVAIIERVCKTGAVSTRRLKKTTLVAVRRRQALPDE